MTDISMATVKQLVWVEVAGYGLITLEASNSIDYYEIRQETNGKYMLRVSYYNGTMDIDFDTIEDAKAFAQDNYRTRVLAALETQTVIPKSIVELPTFVVIADNHDYDAMSQWLVGVYLTREEAVEAEKQEYMKPDVNHVDIHEYTVLVDIKTLLEVIK